MNLISHTFDAYGQWIASWQPRTTCLVVHAAVALATPTVVCLAAFRAGSRAVAIQALAAVAGALFAAGLQVERWMPAGSTGLAWAVTISAILLVILPPVLACLITPRRGPQRHVALLLYIGLLGLLTGNFFWKGGP
jgi:nitrate/nitrite transporter NarK